MEKNFLVSRVYLRSTLIAALIGICLIFVKEVFPCSEEIKKQLTEGAILCVIASAFYGMISLYKVLKSLKNDA
ncbi:MAG: hypothetical protein Q4F75_04600 [Pseudomonadota bacterium]|nr:hypothetical protein [Pseudomonadota bacterium]